MRLIKRLINVLTALIIIIGGIFVILYFCGIVPYIVLSGSMEPSIETGSLCFVNIHSDFSQLKEKEVIAFRLNNGTLVTHRIVEVHDSYVKTKGDNNKNIDGTDITPNNYVGKNIFWIPKVGYVVKGFQSFRGKIVLASCIILLFISGMLFGEDKKNKRKEIKEI